MPLQREDALELVRRAISAGIFNDLGSGSNGDACNITADGTEYLRNFSIPNVRAQKELSYRFRRGTTAWRKNTQRIKDLVDVEETVVDIAPITATAAAQAGTDAMDTS